MAPITMIVVGCGSRGTVYSNIALDEPDRAKVVAVCDPRDHFRLVLGEDCLQRLISLFTEAYKCLQRLIRLSAEACKLSAEAYKLSTGAYTSVYIG